MSSSQDECAVMLSGLLLTLFLCLFINDTEIGLIFRKLKSNLLFFGFMYFKKVRLCDLRKRIYVTYKSASL